MYLPHRCSGAEHIHTLRAQCQKGIVGNLVMQMTWEWKRGLGGKQDCHQGEPSCCGVWPFSSLNNVQIIIMRAVHTHTYTKDSVVTTVWTKNRAMREKNATRAFSDSCTPSEQNIILQLWNTQMICSSGVPGNNVPNTSWNLWCEIGFTLDQGWMELFVFCEN